MLLNDLSKKITVSQTGLKYIFLYLFGSPAEGSGVEPASLVFYLTTCRRNVCLFGQKDVFNEADCMCLCVSVYYTSGDS